jgi:hypothetical protein
MTMEFHIVLKNAGRYPVAGKSRVPDLSNLPRAGVKVRLEDLGSPRADELISDRPLVRGKKVRKVVPSGCAGFS